MSLAPIVKKWGWLRHQKAQAKSKGIAIKLLVVGRDEKVPASFIKTAPPSIKSDIKSGTSATHWMSGNSENWVLQMQNLEPQNHYGLFTPSPYGMVRDLVGPCFRQILNREIKSCHVEYIGKSEDEFKGLCVGMEMAQYRFKNQWPNMEKNNIAIKMKSSFKNQKALFQEGCVLGEGVNLSRFLVDLPPNALQPKNYADLLKSLFSPMANTKVQVWNSERLKKEGMGLHIAVGQSSEQTSHMVHVQYRGGGKEKPIAYVGKGITFDAGGLDIKPAAGMRLMKKDMGGSASVAGVAYWAIQSNLKLNLDFYFAIAENSVAQKSFRPGDVLTARNGLTVEIHNTDAEGRLVMADVLTVASEKKPRFLIDIATLTGAIKHGLSGSTPGMFSNSDNLAECLTQAGKKRGDVSWRMPLIPDEKARLRSDVADVVNCTSGFGGAVTAALFLEMFTGGVPWAHFDIYAWVESARGPFAASGGSGQVVQAMSAFLSDEAQNHA